MSILEEMHPYPFFGSWQDFDELKQMLNDAISRGIVEEVPVMIARQIPRAESWYREKATGIIYSLVEPEPPARGMWEPVDMEELRKTRHREQ